jgi:hypothetical protein
MHEILKLKPVNFADIFAFRKTLAKSYGLNFVDHVLSFRFFKRKNYFVQIISVPQVIHGALHCAKLECIEEGDDLSSDCAVILLEHQVSKLDQQQHGKGGHLAADLGNRRHFTFKQC